MTASRAIPNEPPERADENWWKQLEAEFDQQHDDVGGLHPHDVGGVHQRHDEPTDVGRLLGLEPIDWSTFWNEDETGHEWLLEPVIPAGRSTAIYAAQKAGKSLLTLDMAAALAVGRAVLDRPAGSPVSVVYLDLEMSRADVRERLIDMGYGPDVDLSGLHYYPLPELPPLDTAEGGAAVVALVERHQADLVVIDTMGRAVEGPENEADTYRRYWTHTGRRLKAAGVTVVRLDHAGKESAKGQRGSSSKGDDPDLVWKLSAADRGSFKLTRELVRVSWVPEHVILHREEEPVLRHVLARAAWPVGTADLAALLEQHDIPVDLSAAKATAALRAVGEGRRRTVVSDAQKYRRAHLSGEVPK